MLKLHAEGEHLLFYAEELLRCAQIPQETLFNSQKTLVSLPLPEFSSFIPPPSLTLSTTKVSHDKDGLLFGTVQIQVTYINKKSKKNIYQTSKTLFFCQKPL